MLLKTIAQDFLDVLFPENCLTCDNILYRHEQHVCLHCETSLARFLMQESLEQKFWGRLPLESAKAYLSFCPHGRTQKLLHAIKYRGAGEAARFIGRKWGKELKEEGIFKLYDLIVPVPIDKHKLKKRGYNQSWFLAQGLSETLLIEARPDVLGRQKAQASQTKKSRYERWENVASEFHCLDAETIKDKKILLVDDVITTGATLEACGQALLEHGASALSVAGIASVG